MPENRRETGQFQPGASGNPGGRPAGLARTARELVGQDGHAIITFWLGVMNDQSAKLSDRLEASKLLADRGWGKTPVVHEPEAEPVDGTTVTKEQRDAAVAEFTAQVQKLIAARDARTRVEGIVNGNQDRIPKPLSDPVLAFRKSARSTSGTQSLDDHPSDVITLA